MTRVLVVEDDLALRNSLARELALQGFEVEVTHLAAEALDLLTRTRVDVLLTDLRLGEDDGFEVLRRLPLVSRETRAILMSAYATAREYQAAIDLGAVRVLCKPFTAHELAQAIQQAVECTVGFHGSVHGLTLVDVLQMLHFGRRTAALAVHDPEVGQICMRDGAIIHAETGALSGEPALARLLRLSAGAMHTTALPASAPQTIFRGFQELILDALRVVDEERKEVPLEWDLADDLAAEPLDTPHRPRTEKERTMGKIDDACKEVVAKTDGAVACGVVDLDSGMLLGIHNASNYTQTLNEIVAAATMDLFRGQNVGRVEQMVRSHRGVPENGEHYFQEVHIASEHNYHFAKTLKKGRAVIMLVTKKTTNIGMGWAQLKLAIPSVEPLVP